MTLERKTSNAILEEGKKFLIAGKEYEVAPPSIATLTMVSALISEQSTATAGEKNSSVGDEIAKALQVASDTKIAEIATTLVLGAKGVKHPPVVSRKKLFWGLYTHTKRANYNEIRDSFLLDWTPKQVGSMILDCLVNSEYDFFLSTTIFLNEAKLTKKTKTTASGQ